MNTITLPTGRTIPLADVTLDVAAQRFFYGVADVTEFLSPSQKRQFAGFDVERANREASDAGRLARGLDPVPDTGETSAVKLFVRGVADDVKTAAQQARDFAGIGPENAGKRSPLFWALLIGGLGFLAWQLGLFAFIRKKLTA